MPLRITEMRIWTEDGKLATSALKYDYAEGSTNVKSVSGGNVVFESTTLSSLQAIAKFIFKTNS
ncbi:MAG: hypothetical protein IJ546_09565 [Prevotella sp.]|nr:hypothetical protein [Prevotella sp.]